ncbi:MAG: Gfo/Idh/MocA family oxidoreductase [Bryobacteraceae bacterium]
MQDPTRRTLLKSAAAAAAIHSSRSPILGANDRINIAVVGVGGRGTAHVREYLNIADVHIAAIVDVNQEAQERAQATVKKAKGHDPKTYSDMRKAFADKGIDAVSIATPNHWHVLTALWAVQAGKDVYVEKPVSHNIFEGQQLLAAARKYGKIVQVGQQSRSTPHKMKAMKLLEEGVIGKLYMAKGLCYKRRKSIGRQPDQPTPPGIDWDIFLGPAPMRPFNANRFKYNWHWFWDTGNGDIGNQGVHEMDVALWGLGKKVFPKSVMSMGGKFVYDDDQETPNTQIASFDFGDGTELQFEVRGLITTEEGGLKLRGGNVVGNLFYGADGVMAVDSAGFQVWKGENRELIMEEKSERGDSEGHFANFVKAVKSRKVEDLNCDVAVGHNSAAFCHMANISYRLGRRLTVDPAKQNFMGDADANRMLTRKYRAPYVVPEKV